jgi:hypothetical protein
MAESIRGSKKMLVAALVGIIFAGIGVGMARIMLTVPSSDWTVTGEPRGRMYPLAQHPIGDRIATYAVLFLFCGSFLAIGSIGAVAALREALMHWVFDKNAGVARSGKRNWPLDQIRALHLKADTILNAPVGVSLMMELASGERVRVIRGLVAKGGTLLDVQAVLQPVGRQMAQWLGVALKLCDETGWRLEGLPEQEKREHVQGDIAAAVGEVEARAPRTEPQVDAPAWLQRPAPRRVRRRLVSMLPNFLGWCVIAVPVVAIMIWIAAQFWAVQGMVTTNAQLIGRFRDETRGRYGVCYGFAVGGFEYTKWDYNVTAAFLAAAKKNGSIRISYLPSNPEYSNIGSPRVELWPENWPAWAVVLIPYSVVAVLVAMRLRRDWKRIGEIVLLGRWGFMIQGQVFRPGHAGAEKRTPVRVSIGGLPISWLWQSAANDPNLARYEFVVGDQKRFGYVPANLPGVFRPGGMIGVVYDALHPDVHAALPEIERYLTIE